MGLELEDVRKEIERHDRWRSASPLTVFVIALITAGAGAFFERFGEEAAVSVFGEEDQRPVAHITWAERELETREPSVFSGAASFDQDGMISGWNWSINSEHVGSEEQLLHTFEKPGDFVVKLEVTDEKANTEVLAGGRPAAVFVRVVEGAPDPAIDPLPPIRQLPRDCQRIELPPDESISTEGGTVVRGDDEIDTDDWTSVDVAYRVVISADRKSLLLQLTWGAQERNGDRSPGDTYIQSRGSFNLFSVPSRCADASIASVEGYEPQGSRTELFSGKNLHGFLNFPDTGSLTNVRVRIDGRGGRDSARQALTARFSGFVVHLEPLPPGTQ